MPAALVMRKYGYKAGLVTGLFFYSAGTFLFGRPPTFGFMVSSFWRCS